MSEQDHNNMRRRWLDALAGEIRQWELREFDESLACDDAFCGRLSFGTGGIRCRMGVGPNRMNRLTVGRITQGLCRWLASIHSAKVKVALVYDTRMHSEEFARIAAGVFASNGMRVLMYHTPQPTPLLGYAIRRLGCVGGVCITASHNPKEWNGYKVYDAQGVQATNDMARAIQDCIEHIDPFADVKSMPFDEAVSGGMVSFVDDEMLQTYRREVLSERLGVDCAGLRVVYSPLDGTGLAHAPHLLHELGAECLLVRSQSKSDGRFRSCPKPNPEELDAMKPGLGQMQSMHADLLVVTDPDADRLGVACMHEGAPRVITGDELGLLLFDFVAGHTHGVGTNSFVAVTTIVGSPLAGRIAKAYGVELRKTLTGFKYIGEQIGCILHEGKCFLLGFEESDGYLKGTYVRDKDGLNALVLACELAAYYKRAGLNLAAALERLYKRYGYVLGKHFSISCDGNESGIGAPELMQFLRDRPPRIVAARRVICVRDYMDGLLMPVVADGVAGSSSVQLPCSNVLEWQLEGGASVMVRPSGTEPKLKVYLFAQGDGREQAQRLLDELLEGVRKELGDRVCPNP